MPDVQALGRVSVVRIDGENSNNSGVLPLLRKALTRTTTLTFPPPSSLAGIDEAASRERSEGVEAEE